MKAIQHFVLSHRLNIRVVHHLPGRLRIHIPLLREVSPAYPHITEMVKRFFCLPRGVGSVEPNFTTGNVLIRYDYSVITEQEVLVWIHQFKQIVLTHWERWAAISEEEWPEVLDRLEKVLKESLRHRLIREKEIKIPDDVWPQE